MIVDDDDDFRRLIALIVGSKGFETLEAVDGVDAIEQIDAGIEPSLILLDLRMPRMNGTEFLHALRHGTHAPEVPVVVITGDPGAVAEALAAGANDCLRKPLESKALVESVRQYAVGSDATTSHA
jgi:chemosensory pili system protein ChpA (sensor histidine kinase/response regulator)